MSRRKQEAVYVPTSRAEAEAMLAEYKGLERDKLMADITADRMMDQVRERRRSRLADLDAKAVPIFDGLKAWWEAGGKDEVAGPRRSAELAGAKIGIRLSPAALKTERKVTLKAVTDWLKGLRWKRKKEFLRPKVELDKDASKAAIQSDESVAKKFAGRLKVVQADQFFIDTGLDAETLKKETAG